MSTSTPRGCGFILPAFLTEKLSPPPMLPHFPGIILPSKPLFGSFFLLPMSYAGLRRAYVLMFPDDYSFVSLRDSRLFLTSHLVSGHINSLFLHESLSSAFFPLPPLVFADFLLPPSRPIRVRTAISPVLFDLQPRA